jgi:hypothetical protein
MRSDMKKVVVERPRWGSRRRNEKFGAKLRYIPDHDYDDQPKKVRGFESYGEGGCGKYFTDVLGPLYRFLRSNVGRPWNKVYSELCAGLDKRKATGLHIFQHLESMVRRDCYIDDNRKVRCIKDRDREVSGFYVHPRTGLLCEAPRQSSRERKRTRLQFEPVTRFMLGDNVAYQKHEDIWYRVKLQHLVVSWKDEFTTVVYDLFLKRKVKLNGGENWVAIEKKQCNREELKEVNHLLEEHTRKLRRM